MLFYAIPVFMFGIAIHQLLQIQKGLTRWKGGGYGMYSEIHPYYRQVVINDSLIKIDTDPDNKRKNVAVRKFAYFPKEKYKQNMIKELNWPNDTLNIQIYQLFFDSKTQILNKKIKTNKELVLITTL